MVELNRNFCLPQYQSGSLMNVPHTALSLFGGQGTSNRQLEPWAKFTDHLGQLSSDKPKKVILFLLDGLGYKNLFRGKLLDTCNFFNIARRRGYLNQITSVFPSTTAAAMVAVNSGLTPAEHGLLEWNLYLEELGQVIETIPFKPFKSKISDSLVEYGGNGSMLFDGLTIYESLLKNIKSFVFSPKQYVDTVFSKTIYKGAQRIGYDNGVDMMINLARRISMTEEDSYYFVYYDCIDQTGHAFGPSSAQYHAQIELFSFLFMNVFLNNLDVGQFGETIILLTADHGQVDVSPGSIVHLDDHVDLENCLKRTSDSRIIIPTGSPRDTFLHVKTDKLGYVVGKLREVLNGKADVLYAKEALDSGLFGDKFVNSERFWPRIGNVVLLPHGKNVIWSRFHRKGPMDSLGIHGGLHEDEMTVPFVSARLKDFVI